MTTVRVLTGSKQQIAAGVAELSGTVREAVVFINDDDGQTVVAAAATGSDAFAEMVPYTVAVGDAADYSRPGIYGRAAGE